jgi:hypothetical protein
MNWPWAVGSRPTPSCCSDQNWKWLLGATLSRKAYKNSSAIGRNLPDVIRHTVISDESFTIIHIKLGPAALVNSPNRLVHYSRSTYRSPLPGTERRYTFIIHKSIVTFGRWFVGAVAELRTPCHRLISLTSQTFFVLCRRCRWR